MGPVDIIVIVLICLIVGVSVFYVIRAKRRGVKCIGCPQGCSCSSKIGGCGSCAGCEGTAVKDDQEKLPE